MITRNFILCFLILLILIPFNLSYISISGQTPSNDDCEGAYLFPLPDTSQRNTTPSPIPPYRHTRPVKIGPVSLRDAKPSVLLKKPCALEDSPDLWYKILLEKDTLFYFCIFVRDAIATAEIALFMSNELFSCDTAHINCAMFDSNYASGFLKMRGLADEYSHLVYWSKPKSGHSSHWLIPMKAAFAIPQDIDLIMNFLAPPVSDLPESLCHCVKSGTSQRVNIHLTAMNVGKQNIRYADVLPSLTEWKMNQIRPSETVDPGAITVSPTTGPSTTIYYRGNGPFVGLLDVRFFEEVEITGCSGWRVSSIKLGPPDANPLEGKKKVAVYNENPYRCHKDTFRICFGETGQLTENCGSNNGCVEFDEWEWTPNKYLLDNKSASPFARPTKLENITYSVKHTCKKCNCSTSYPVVLVVEEAPPLVISASPETACVGEEITFEVTTPTGTPPDNPEWDFGDGTIIPGERVVHSFNRPGIYDVVVKARAGIGCPATGVTTVIITEGGKINLTYQADPCKCAIILETSLTGGTPPFIFDYDWENDGFFDELNAGNKVSHQYPPPRPNENEHQIRIKVKDAANCVVDTVFDFFCSTPLSISVSPGNKDCCKREHCFIVYSKGGYPPYKYSFDWDNDGIYDLLNETPPENFEFCHQFERGYLSGSKDYIVNIISTDSLGCSGSTVISGEICDNTYVKDCCYDYEYDKNYLACVESYLDIFCEGRFSFWHYSIPSFPPAKDTIDENTRKCANQAYLEASANPIIKLINSNLSYYPELHLIRGFTREGIEEFDFANTVLLSMFYKTPYEKKVDEKYLRIFWLDTTNCSWNIIDESEPIPEENKVIANVGELGKVFTIMGYIPPEKFLDNCSNYPNPFRAEKNGEKTTITYTLTENASVDVNIFDFSGGLIKTWHFEPGKDGGRGKKEGIWHRIDWDGINNEGRFLSNGAYLGRIDAISDESAKKEFCEWVIVVSK